MLDAKIAHPPRLHFSIFDRIFNSPPAFEPLGFPSVGTMQEIQVNVAKTTSLYRCLDGFARRIIRLIRLEL